MKLLRSVAVSRYAHLCLGLFALYGLSSLITYTSDFEKIIDGLKCYCYADYEVRNSLFPKEKMEAEFYREKYKERLSSLGEGFFDYRDKKQVQAFFVSKGLLFDVWWEKNRNTYLLAQVIEKGQHKAAVPEEVVFNYFILGDKKIIPFPEYDKGRGARVFVSVGEKAVYIHKDSIDYLLSWYFDSLWESNTRSPKGFYIEWNGHKDPLTYSLYRDLREICEHIFEKRLYRNKKEAKQYFMEEGFKVFLPTILAMGARMVADQDSKTPETHRYFRALLTGLYLKPNYTMFYLAKKSQPNTYNSTVWKLWGEFRQQLNMDFPDDITLDQISQTAKVYLDKA